MGNADQVEDEGRPVSKRDFYGSPRRWSFAYSIGAMEGEIDRFANLLRYAFRQGMMVLP